MTHIWQNYEWCRANSPFIICTSIKCTPGGDHRDKSMFDNITSSNGNIFRVTGPLCGEFTGHQKPVTRRFDVFVDLRLNARLSEQLRRDLRRRGTYYDVTVMNASDRKSVSIPLNYEKVLNLPVFKKLLFSQWIDSLWVLTISEAMW